MKKIPITYAIFWIGSLAIMGIYPLSGYYSKDAILEFLFESMNSPDLNIFAKIAYILGMISVFFTCLYSLKILLRVFHRRSSHNSHDDQHSGEIEVEEPPKIMLIPLYILALGSVTSGYVLTKYFSIKNPSFWLNSLSMNYVNSQEEEIIPFSVKIMPFIITSAGFVLSLVDYFSNYKISGKLSHILSLFIKLLKNKFYFDEVYEILFVKTYRHLSNISANIFDMIIIDRFFINNWGKYFSFLSRRISVIQSGYIYNYAVIIIFFTVSIISYVIFYWGVGK